MPDPRFEPAFQPDAATREALADFVALVRHLRRDCPWDRAQTHASTQHLLLEEAFEAADAITRRDWPDLRGELGDVLLHVVFHSVIAEQDGNFALLDVVRGVTEKLVRRHPHVFGDAAVSGTGEVLRNWEAIKQAEAGPGAAPRGVLDGVPGALPALVQAQRVQEKVAGVGFDFPDAAASWGKVEEEMGEYRAAAASGDAEAAAGEFGDVLFALVNHARLSGIGAEAALQATTARFRRRFAAVEAALRADGARRPQDASLAEMDALWDAAKAAERDAVASGAPAPADPASGV